MPEQFRRGVRDERLKANMLAWDVEKKWLMINQDRQAEHIASGRKTALDDDDPDAPPPLLNTLAEKAGEMWSATWDAGARKLDKYAAKHSHRMSTTLTPPTITPIPSTSTGAVPPGGLDDKYGPEYFIRRFMEADLRGVTVSLVGHLEVNLRTRPIE